MAEYWIVLAAVVRLLFLAAPFLKVDKDFALHGETLHEAREFSNAANCRAMLASIPAVFLVAVLAEADKTCRAGLAAPSASVYFLAAVVLIYGLIKLPAWLYRGTFIPFAWFLLLTAIEVATQAFALAPAVALICR